MNTLENLIIIGSGPAGYTAAIYAARANLNPLVIESSVEAGGALMNTTDIENFPGFPEGIMGPVLMDNMRAQAERFGARFIMDDATSISFGDEIMEHKVKISSGEVYPTKSIIIATGSAYKKLGIPREDDLAGHGVSYCATCDGFFFKEKPIIVVGGGDSAVEEALFLAKFGSSVTLLVRSNKLRASKVLQERILKDDRIKILFNTETHELHGEGLLNAVSIVDTLTGVVDTLPASGFFVAIGSEPRTKLVENYVDLDETGHILLEEGPHGKTQTEVAGVFVAGDVADHRYRQAITAAGSGAQAAIDAEKWLESIK